MEVSVDISLYTLTDKYRDYVQSFIDRLNNTAGLTIVENTISTQVFGDYDLVMDTLKKEIKLSWEEFGTSIFVCKFLGLNLDPALDPHQRKTN